MLVSLERGSFTRRRYVCKRGGGLVRLLVVNFKIHNSQFKTHFVTFVTSC
jgi:hypothetical protein